MKKIFFILFILIIVGSLGFITQTVFAWDNLTNHPALTNEAVDFYNLHFNNQITNEEKEWIIQGSINEDTPPRWVNHFYDPIYKQGWTGEKGPEKIWWYELAMEYPKLLSPQGAVSAVDWAHNQELQAKYKLYKGNQTWEKAIYEYVENQNKEKAYLALGYVLHLIQDVAVPDHTRSA